MHITHSRAEWTRAILMSRLREELERGNERVIVLVPEQITLQTELDIVDSLDINGTFAIQVMSPAKLYTRVFEAAGEPDGVPVDERGRALLLGAALKDLGNQLKWYAGVADRPGFVSKALAQLSELKNAGVTPDELARMSDEAAEPALKNKLMDIARIYEAYDGALAGRFADSADRQRECLRRFVYARFMDGAHVYMYGFDMITPPLERLAVALCARVERIELIIALPKRGARDYPVYESVALSLNRLALALMQSGGELSVKYEEGETAGGEIDVLRRELFAHPVHPYTAKPSRVRLQILRDPFDEAMEVAAQARELARSGMRWRDMAVVSPRMDEYRHCLERAFSLYGVPLFISHPRALAGEPLPRYLLSALRALAHGMRQEDMLDCLKSGFGMSDRDAQVLENYIVQFGVTGRKFIQPFRRGGEELVERVEPLRKRFVEPLQSLKLRLESAATMGEQASALFMLLEEQAALDSLKAREAELLAGARSGGGHALRRSVEAAYSAQVWNKLMGLLDQLYLLLGEREADAELLYTLMRSALECDEVRVLPQSADAVAAGKVGDIKPGRVKALFLIGMQDMPPSADEQLLTDPERADIESRLKVSLGMNSKQKQLLKSVDLLGVLACAQKYAIFSHAMSNFSGAGERPGDAILRLRRAFPELKSLGLAQVDAMLPIRLGSAAAAREQIAPLSRRGLMDGTLPKAARGAWTALYRLPGGGADMIERALTHKVESRPLPGGLTRRLYHGLRSVSITRLEQHARCPFAEFVQYGLRPVENLKYEIQPRDKGMFYHEAVETFTRRVIAAGGFDKFTPEQLMALMDGVTLELERKWCALIPLGEDSLMRARSRDMIRTAKRAAMTMSRQMAGSAYGPSMLEIEFGDAGELTLDLPDGPLRVRGRIDRVDLMDTGDLRCLRVIDYKLGGKGVSLSEMYYGLQLQLLTYLCAALSIKPGFEPAAALYFAVKDPIIDADMMDDKTLESKRINRLRMNGLVVNDPRMISMIAERPSEVIPIRFKISGEPYSADWLVSREELDMLMAHARELIANIAQDIRRGVTDIAPCISGNYASCEHCDYRGICQFSADLPGAHVRRLESLSAQDIMDLIRAHMREERKEERGYGMD
jgi:ATP-dependent helicase/nuclease subunit B